MPLRVLRSPVENTLVSGSDDNKFLAMWLLYRNPSPSPPGKRLPPIPSNKIQRTHRFYRMGTKLKSFATWTWSVSRLCCVFHMFCLKGSFVFREGGVKTWWSGNDHLTIKLNLSLNAFNVVVVANIS